MQLTSDRVIEFDESEIASAVGVDFDESAEISSIAGTVFESIEKKTSIKKRQLMSIFAVTPRITPESAMISEANFDPTFVPKAPNSNRRTRRPVSKVSDNAIAMNTRSRKQAYAAALKKMTDFSSYYSAFAVRLIRPDFEPKIRLHRDSLPIESKHWHQMLKHRFAKKFQLAASQKIKKLEKRDIYQIIEKKNQNQIKISLT